MGHVSGCLFPHIVSKKSVKKAASALADLFFWMKFQGFTAFTLGYKRSPLPWLISKKSLYKSQNTFAIISIGHRYEYSPKGLNCDSPGHRPG
jgi:hypothetical protein